MVCHYSLRYPTRAAFTSLVIHPGAVMLNGNWQNEMLMMMVVVLAGGLCRALLSIVVDRMMFDAAKEKCQLFCD